jgi:uncharacterized tellurite resistance protein B-like protein
MTFMRFLRGGDAPANSQPAGPTANLATETEAVRHIVGRLEAMPLEQARFLAGSAYVLARAAYADMDISPEETAVMEQELVSSGLDQSQAVLVVEMAKLQERTTGATSDFLVTREFRDNSSPEQRLALLRACFHVCAADDAISGTESGVLNEIANELDIPRADISAIRSEFGAKFSARLGFGT